MIANGVEIIATERDRQREKWPLDHDDRHLGGELAAAAAVYAIPNMRTRETQVGPQKAKKDKKTLTSLLWPFERDAYKPRILGGGYASAYRARVEELAKAGALIAAEIDRLQRKLDEHGGAVPIPEDGGRARVRELLIALVTHHLPLHDVERAVGTAVHFTNAQAKIEKDIEEGRLVRGDDANPIKQWAGEWVTNLMRWKL